MAKTFKYDAFISYRHCEPDNEIASKLQKKLEGFRLPKEIAKKVGRTRLRRVFRDETEFAVSDDLTQAINDALLNSDYLIAICSPEYLKSSWCRKEIESFLKYHDRKHILLVLADGEPREAFPPEAISEDVYKVGPDGMPYKTKSMREPLAADCRGATAKERNTKIDKAVIRLIAAILGIRFDDLQQRHRQEQYKRTRNRVLTVFAVLVAFLAVSLGFLIRIAKQNKEIARANEIISLKYADTLAATSDNLLRDGKRTDAVYAARLALSDEKTDNYSELATKALVNALGIYDKPNTFGCDDDALLPCTVLENLDVSSHGGYASVKDLDGIRYVVEMNSGATVMSFAEKDDASFVFDGEKGFVFKKQEDNYCYYDFETGKETDLGLSEAFLYSNTEGEGYVFWASDSLAMLNGPVVLWYVSCHAEGFSEARTLDVKVNFATDANECYILITDYENQTTTLYIIDTVSGESRRILVAHRVCLYVVTDGKSIVWVQTEDEENSLCFMDVVTGGRKSTPISEFVYDLAVMNNDIVLISETGITICNLNLEEVDRIDAGGNIRSYVSGDAICLMDSEYHLYMLRNGSYERYDTVPDDDTFSWMQVIRNGNLYAALTGDNHIYTYSFRHSDYMNVAGDYEPLQFSYCEQGDLSRTPVASSFVTLVMKGEPGFEQNRIKTVAMCKNANMGLIQLYDGAVHIFDSTNGEKIKTIYSIEGSVNLFYYDDRNGYYYISSMNVDIYDENFKNIYSITDCVLAGIENESGAIVVYDLKNGDSEFFSGYYALSPVTYEQLIPMADEFLSGYEPDERVKEKYSLG